MKLPLTISAFLFIVLLGSLFILRTFSNNIFEPQYEYAIPEYSRDEIEIIENVLPKILTNVRYDHPIYISSIEERSDSIIVEILPVDALRVGLSRFQKIIGLHEVFTMFDYKTIFIFDRNYILLNPDVPEV